MNEFKTEMREKMNAETPLVVQPDSSVPTSASDDDAFDADAFAERVLQQKQVFRSKNSGAPYVCFCNNMGRRETMRLDQPRLVWYLICRYHQENCKSILESKFTAVIQRLKAQAMQGRTVFPVHSRIAMRADSLYYNLGNETGDIVHVDRTGWRILRGNDLPTDLFFDASYTMAPQVTPVKTDSSVTELLKRFIHIHGDEFQLFVVALLSQYLETVSKPIIMLEGLAGSGKSSIIKVIQNLVDPVLQDPSSLEQHSRDVQALLGAQYLVAYDNIESISGKVSDVLCNAVTGGAVAVRRLYTNGGVHTQSFHNAIVLNGIDISGLKPDLLTRVVAFELRNFGDENDKRLAETQLWVKFKALRGELLGAIFNTLAAAYAAEPCHKIPAEFRMSDFYDWGSRFCHILYGDEKLFHRLYAANRMTVNSKMVEEDPLCTAFLEYAALPEHRDRETETSGELYRNFRKFAEKKAGFNVNQRAFPKDASAFSKKLKIMAPVLEANGIGIENRRTNTGRFKTIRVLKS